MRFTPQTADEIISSTLLQDGKYPFEVVDAKDKTSKSGNEMIELQLRIYDQQDKAHFIYDYLLESMKFKLLHFCEAAFLSDKYASGLLVAADCIGKKGYAEVFIQEDKNKQYAPKNSIKDYITSDNIAPVKTEGQGAEFFDDALPF